MSLQFIPVVELTKTEQDIVHQSLVQPVVQKYFLSLAWQTTEEILTNNSPRDGETAESFLRVQQNLYGRLEAINTLLSMSQAIQPSN